MYIFLLLESGHFIGIGRVSIRLLYSCVFPRRRNRHEIRPRSADLEERGKVQRETGASGFDRGSIGCSPRRRLLSLFSLRDSAVTRTTMAIYKSLTPEAVNSERTDNCRDRRGDGDSRAKQS